MRKRGLFFFLFQIILLGQLKSQVISIPDDNFLQALIDKGIDKNHNGQIDSLEAISVDSISVPFQNIFDLTGIEAFINITFLNCYYNIIPSLDMSHNTKLKTLYCDNNPLTSLNVTKNKNLQMLTFNDTYLTTVNLSKNFNLTWLSCDNGALTSLDLSKNINLQFLQLMDLSKLTSIDLYYNINLQDIEVSENPNLKKIKFPPIYFPMTRLLASRNDLSDTLDLSSALSEGANSIAIEGNAHLKVICLEKWEDSMLVFKDVTARYSLCNLVTGLSDSKEIVASQNFHPNPTRGIVYFQQDVSFVYVYNTFSEIILYKENNPSILDLTQLQAGMYQVLTVDKWGQQKVGKLVKE